MFLILIEVYILKMVLLAYDAPVYPFLMYVFWVIQQNCSKLE